MVQEALEGLEEAVILPIVHAHHKHGGINRRDRNGDFLALTSSEPSIFQGSKDTSRLYILSNRITPFGIDGISLLEDGNGLSIDDKLPILSIDCATELATCGILLEHLDHVVEINEEVIEGNIGAPGWLS